MTGGKTIAKNFADGDKNDRADDRPGGRREPADYRDEHHFHRERNGKHGIGINVTKIKRIEATSDAEDKGRDEQSNDARAHSSDANRLGTVDIFPPRREIGPQPRP